MWSLKNTQYCYITELRGQFSIALSVDFLLFYCAHHSPKCWHAVMGHRLCRQTCLAPEEFKNSRSGPWPKKVVHHWDTVSYQCNGLPLSPLSAPLLPPRPLLPSVGFGRTSGAAFYCEG